MKRLLGGGLVVGLAASVSLAFAAPSGAQEVPAFVLLDATVEPVEVGPGGAVTVTPVDNCTVAEPGSGDDILIWALFPAGDFSWESGSEDGVPLIEGDTSIEDDGSWTVELTAPDMAGAYEFFAACLPSGLEIEDPAALSDAVDEGVAEGTDETVPEGEQPDEGEIPEEIPDFEVYGPEALTVTDNGTPAPAPPVAGPAEPVPGRPTFTG